MSVWGWVWTIGKSVVGGAEKTGGVWWMLARAFLDGVGEVGGWIIGLVVWRAFVLVVDYLYLC